MTSPDQLRDIVARYGDPDPALVSKLPKGGTTLSYMGHAEVTRALLDIDPAWSWEPVALDEMGLPRIITRGSMSELWIRLTVLGVTRLGVGTCESKKAEQSKELIGDALRNAAMRFGFALALWSKAEWDSPAHPTTTIVQNSVTVNTSTGEVIEDPFEWCHEEMLKAESVAALDAVANLAKHRLTDTQRAELRPLYLERKAELEGAEA